jgi:hypothetical protein
MKSSHATHVLRVLVAAVSFSVVAAAPAPAAAQVAVGAAGRATDADD